MKQALKFPTFNLKFDLEAEISNIIPREKCDIYIYIGCRQPKYLLAEIQFFPHSNCRSPAASPKQRAPKAQAAPEEKVQGPHTSGNVVWGGVLG